MRRSGSRVEPSQLIQAGGAGSRQRQLGKADPCIIPKTCGQRRQGAGIGERPQGRNDRLWLGGEAPEQPIDGRGRRGRGRRFDQPALAPGPGASQVADGSAQRQVVQGRAARGITHQGRRRAQGQLGLDGIGDGQPPGADQGGVVGSQPQPDRGLDSPQADQLRGADAVAGAGQRDGLGQGRVQGLAQQAAEAAVGADGRRRQPKAGGDGADLKLSHGQLQPGPADGASAGAQRPNSAPASAPRRRRLPMAGSGAW